MFELIIGFIIGIVWHNLTKEKDYWGEDWPEFKQMLLKEGEELEDREEKGRK